MDHANQKRVELPSEALERYRELGTVWQPIFAALTLLGVLFSIHEIFRLGWKEAHERANQKKLAHLEKVNKRWAVFAEDAQDRIAKTRKTPDLAREWREIVEKEVGLAVD
jgi:hypothetical protein